MGNILQVMRTGIRKEAMFLSRVKKKRQREGLSLPVMVSYVDKDLKKKSTDPAFHSLNLPEVLQTREPSFRGLGGMEGMREYAGERAETIKDGFFAQTHRCFL